MAKYAISAFGHFEWHPNYTASDFCGNPLKPLACKKKMKEVDGNPELL